MHYIEKILKQDSLGYRELTKRGMGGLKETGGKVGREGGEEGEGKKLKTQAHGTTSWRPVWAM